MKGRAYCQLCKRVVEIATLEIQAVPNKRIFLELACGHKEYLDMRKRESAENR